MSCDGKRWKKNIKINYFYYYCSTQKSQITKIIRLINQRINIIKYFVVQLWFLVIPKKVKSSIFRIYSIDQYRFNVCHVNVIYLQFIQDNIYILYYLTIVNNYRFVFVVSIVYISVNVR